VSPSLEERVARQETAEDVRGLFASYRWAVDAQDPAGLTPIFSPDIVVTAGGTTFDGLDAAISFFSESWSSPAVRRHFITNVAITDLGPSSATASASFLVVSAAGGDPRVGWGTYAARFDRDDAGTLRYSAIDMALEVDVDVRHGWGAELAVAGPAGSWRAP